MQTLTTWCTLALTPAGGRSRYESEEEMFVDMHLYIERLVSVTR